MIVKFSGLYAFEAHWPSYWSRPMVFTVNVLVDCGASHPPNVVKQSELVPGRVVQVRQALFNLPMEM